ncbi:MAG: DUF1304 domain-containing protein [Erythrobacter sp.]|nr:DUF1304 domain-containing protein [Erythrobacter sp.]
MRTVANILVGMVAALHVYIAWFEMFAWVERGPRVFPSFPPDLFAQTVTLAANQGLYNGFLAAGLIWSLLIGDKLWRARIAFFFLVCVAVAGVVGALTASPRIVFVQTVPAMAAMLFVFLAHRKAA